MQVPDPLRDLGWELPHNFLGLDEQHSEFDNAGTVILPVPYEATVSFGGGTRNGPRAILEASRYIETYDQELDADPFESGVATLPSLVLSGVGPEEAIRELREAYDRVLDASFGKFVVMLGGEHSISSASILAWSERLAATTGPSSGRRLTVLQFDAHTDLRPDYDGSAYSHASVMHRVHDKVDLVSVGIRALTRAEREVARSADNINIFFADDIHDSDSWMKDVIKKLGEDVYISFDVDCFDPSMMPSTGTPEPGGLMWYPVLQLLRRVFKERNVLAADIVELAPIPGLHAPDFVIAKLIYKMIGYKYFG